MEDWGRGVGEVIAKKWTTELLSESEGRGGKASGSNQSGELEIGDIKGHDDIEESSWKESISSKLPHSWSKSISIEACDDLDIFFNLPEGISALRIIIFWNFAVAWL